MNSPFSVRNLQSIVQELRFAEKIMTIGFKVKFENLSSN